MTSIDDECFDLQGFIDAELARGKTEIEIPPVRYRIKPRNKQHLLLEGLKGIRIIADDVEIVCTETTRAIAVTNCSDVSIRGLAIDYDPLPFTQGKIIGFGCNDNNQFFHEIELFGGYLSNEFVNGINYEIYDPCTRCLRYGDYYGITVDKTSKNPRRIVVTLPQKYDKSESFERPEKIGDIVVIGCTYSPNGELPHAICATNCNRLRLENVTVHASNYFGFLELNSEASTFLRCRVDRRPLATDIKLREDPRIRSLNADAFHSKNARIGPSIVDCFSRYNGDDSVNICGDYHLIVSATDWVMTDKDNYCYCELRVLAKNNDGNSINVRTGDSVELTVYNGERFRDNPVVTSVLPDGEITEKEFEFVKRQSIDNAIKNEGLKQAFRIQLGVIDSSSTLRYMSKEKPSMGSVISSTNRIGNGFLIEGCDFGQNRSRGIIVKASQGVIARNQLTGNWGEAILVAPNYWWLESGSSNTIQIRGNTIRNCRSYGIGVYSVSGDSRCNHTFAPAGAHSDITVSNNLLIRCPLPNILITSTHGYEIVSNEYQKPLKDTKANGPPSVKRIVDPKDPHELMVLNCENGIVSAGMAGWVFLEFFDHKHELYEVE